MSMRNRESENPSTDSLTNRPNKRSHEPQRSRLPQLRLAVLLLALGTIVLFAGYRWLRAQAVSQVLRSLACEENVRAIEEIRSIESRYGKNSETCLLAARAYRRLRQQSLFERSLELSRQFGAESQQVRHEKLLYESQLGQVPDLASRIDTLLDGHESDFDEMASSLMYGLLARQELEPASKLLAAWQSASPNSPGSYLFQGMFAIWQRDWERAKAILEPAVASHPDYVPFYLQLGIAYSGLNANEEACAAFGRYLASVPDDANAALKHAVALKKLGRSHESLDVLLRLIEKGQTSTDYYLQAAKIYLEDNDGQKAVKLLTEAARLWPEDVPIASAMSQAYNQLGDEQSAKRFADVAEAGQKAVEGIDAKFFELARSSHRTAEECYELGHLLLHKQSRENGILWLQTALQIDPQHIPSHRDMALFYDRTNQPQLAAIHHRFVNNPNANP